LKKHPVNRLKSVYAWLSSVRPILQNLALVITGSLLLAVDLNLFLAPSNIAPGGVSGLAIILNEFTGWPIGLTMLLLNIPLMALGFWYLGGWRFLSSSLLAVLIFNLGVDILAPWLPPNGLTDDVLLNALFGGVVGGIGYGLVFRAGGSTAGTGVVSRILQIRTGVPVSQLYLITDGGIILVAALVFGWEQGLYAIISLFVWGLATDYVLEGPSVIRTAFIVTNLPQTVGDAILGELRIGVTAWLAAGMFTDASRTVLFCTVSRYHERTLIETVSRADPEAFIVVGHGHQARGGMFGPQTQSEAGRRDQRGAKSR
jgi:uncharacterized membrane-anchored protein YitT (DUF2179 family)